MGVRNIVLTDRQEALVAGLIASGRYQNISEAMRAGLRLLEREEIEISEISNRLKLGVQQAQHGALAEGSGTDAIRRAFAAKRRR